MEVLRDRIFQIDKVYRKGKVQGCIFAITKDEDYLQNLDKPAKVRNLEKHINQIVYKRYGLTEEEIKIVEGKR